MIDFGEIYKCSPIALYVQPCFLKATAILSRFERQPRIGPKRREICEELSGMIN